MMKKKPKLIRKRQNNLFNHRSFLCSIKFPSNIAYLMIIFYFLNLIINNNELEHIIHSFNNNRNNYSIYNQVGSKILIFKAEASPILFGVGQQASAQDVTVEALELAEEEAASNNFVSSSGIDKNNNSDNNVVAGKSNKIKNKFKTDEELIQEEEKFKRENEKKTLNDFLDNLPTLSVAQKHSATIECDLDNKNNNSSKLVWVKLTKPISINVINNNNNNNDNVELNDIKLISFNQKIITPDKRFKVTRQTAFKWILTIDNVNTEDNQAYFLCQVSSPSIQLNGNSFRKDQKINQSNMKQSNNKISSINEYQSSSPSIAYAGGAKLNVLFPPRIIEQENSLIQVNEYERFSLRCKAISEPQAQLIWKREDGKSLDDNLEQIFKHEIERRKNSNQMASIDSSELIFNSVNRNQAGAYLCIASNGVQPGVSQRTSVKVVNCRSSPTDLYSQEEPCEEKEIEQQTTTTTTTTTAMTTTTIAALPTEVAIKYRSKLDQTQYSNVQQQQQQQQNSNNSIKNRKNWKLSNGSTNGNQNNRQQRLPAIERNDKRMRTSLANDLTYNNKQTSIVNPNEATSGASATKTFLISSSIQFQIINLVGLILSLSCWLNSTTIIIIQNVVIFYHSRKLNINSWK